MNRLLSNLYGMALMFSSLPMINNDEEKARIRKEWKESMNLPRKAKKKRRKELLIDWSIVNW